MAGTEQESFFQGSETHRPAYGSQATPAISYGLRFPEACAHHVSTDLAGKRIYIIASKSLATKTDALERLTKALEGRVVGMRKGVGAHTPLEDVVTIANEAHRLDIDCLVTLGAGSITDCAKLVRLALANTTYDTHSLMHLADHFDHKPRIPIICIPTSLSGGEYQARAAGTDPATKHKLAFFPGVEVDLVIQDPELCVSTPDTLWFASGIRAVDHCVETLCSLVSNAEGDAWARSGLHKLVPSLLETKARARDVQARHRSQLGVMDAMRAPASGIPLGASHGIGHQLGPLGVGHGETSCILLPAVCKYNARMGANNARQAAVAGCLLEHDLVVEAVRRRGLDPAKADLGDVLDVVIRELGLPRRLGEVDVGREQLAGVARNSVKVDWCKTNAVPLTEEGQVMEILESVL